MSYIINIIIENYLKRTNLDSKIYVLNPKSSKIDKRLAKRQTQAYWVENVWDVFLRLDNMEHPISVEFQNIFNSYSHEDVSEQKKFLA